MATSSLLICPRRNQVPRRGKDLARATQPVSARMLKEAERDCTVGLVSRAGVALLRIADPRGRQVYV